MRTVSSYLPDGFGILELIFEWLAVVQKGREILLRREKPFSSRPTRNSWRQGICRIIVHGVRGSKHREVSN